MGWGVAQVGGQAVAQCLDAFPEAGLRPIEAEHPPDGPPDGEQRPHDGEVRSCIERRPQVDQSPEVVRVAGRWQCPHVQNLKVIGDVVDSPRP